MVVYRVAFQQVICLQQGWGKQCRQKDKEHLGMDGRGRVSAVRYNLRKVSGTCLCGHNIAAEATGWTVTGQLGFYRKAKRQEAQAKG